MVLINQHCISCGLCINYCPVGALSIPTKGEPAIVDQISCVECGACYRSEICPENAIIYPKLSYPRSIRRHFSDPTSRHEVTGVPGRGTEEIKTNDVTNRFQIDHAGFCIEVGRPGVGTSIREVEKITKVLSQYDIAYEEKNPMRQLLSNVQRGEIKKEVLDERVLSMIIEFIVSEDKVPKMLKTLKNISCKLNTVFSLSIAGRILNERRIPIKNILDQLKVPYRPNAKINLGMGKALEGS
jgi:NAD-dependent dihydropyrimidine dehydrogenase PreA subunit